MEITVSEVLKAYCCCNVSLEKYSSPATLKRISNITGFSIEDVEKATAELMAKGYLIKSPRKKAYDVTSKAKVTQEFGSAIEAEARIIAELTPFSYEEAKEALWEEYGATEE